MSVKVRLRKPNLFGLISIILFCEIFCGGEGSRLFLCFIFFLFFAFKYIVQILFISLSTTLKFYILFLFFSNYSYTFNTNTYLSLHSKRGGLKST